MRAWGSSRSTRTATEPTIHKHILDFIDLAQAKPIRNVTLNTNGIRLASDRRFVAALGERNKRRPDRSLNIYLQFDGFAERTHQEIRGKDLRDIKRRALDNCAEVGLTVTLVPAIERGLNEHEIGDIVEFGLGHPAVRSVAFQPVTHSGRHAEFDPMTRLTNPRRDQAAGRAAAGLVRQGRLLSGALLLPDLPHDHLPAHGGPPGEPGFGVLPIPRLLQVEDYLDYVSNRVVPDYAIREALEKLWSASAFVGTGVTEDRLKIAAEALDCADACGVNLPEAIADLGDRAFMIVVQDFLDPYTLNVKQLMKCCVEEITPDGRLVPFCAYNSVGYREQVREQMSGVTIAGVVPNAIELKPLVGATARLLAADYDVIVDGVDLGESTVANARAATGQAGLAAKVRLHLGDAEHLPFPDDSFDAVICECAFCTFPDKAAAAAEFARVLRPGGRIGITDVTITGAEGYPKT